MNPVRSPKSPKGGSKREFLHLALPFISVVWSGHLTRKKFRGSNHITGTAELEVVKFFTQVGYINSSNMMTCHHAM